MTQAQLSLQEDLNTIEQYAQQWAITFSSSKTITQTFSTRNNYTSPQLQFNGQLISKTDTHKHLGLTLSEDLRFKTHVTTIIQKINIALSPLYPIAKFLPRQTLNTIYKTYVRPYFDYCDCIYDGHITAHDELRLERLQNRSARLVTNTLHRTSTDKLRDELGWDSLKTRRKIHRLFLYKKIIDNTPRIPNYITNMIPEERGRTAGRNLRNQNHHTVPRTSKSCYQRSLIPKTSLHWNQLPTHIRNCQEMKKFKQSIKLLLGTPQPPHYNALGTKVGNTLHTQIRLGMSKLNAHQYSIQKVTSPECACGYTQENTKHFILHCPHYALTRSTLFAQVSTHLNIDFNNQSDTMKLDTLLHGHNTTKQNAPQVLLAFQSFLKNTSRLI
ncbi:uncharacterized protein LOC122376591 [Amphibalanus amphitrite]|uniref:uncharacterized protein LOC122376591 n=1 Tax=Amphibalanus amphitrite TaxID=1232801 RepID=UPI001C9156EC|nr:uncharacterized protein LOC122376591 [Amphibalanus amphitrite]